MIDKATEELIQRETDGETTPEESARVREAIARDPEARALHEELTRLVEALSGVESLPPPQGLKENILRAIREEERRPIRELREPNHEAPASTAWRVLRGRATVRYGYAFVAGAAACALLIALFSDRLRSHPVDQANFSGALVPIERLGKPIAEAIAMPGAQGRIEVVFQEDRVVAALLLESDDFADVRIRFPERRNTLVAFFQAEPHSSSLDSEPGEASFRHAGKNTYRLVAAGAVPNEATLRIEIRTNQATRQWDLMRGAE